MRRWMILVCTLLIAMLSLPAIPGLTQEAQVTLIAINVGKADCLILHYQGQSYMIDTGTVQAVGRVRACLEAVGLSHFKGIFVTHSDKDHYGGLNALGQGGVTWDALYASPMTSEKNHALADYDVCWLSAGDRIVLAADVYFDVLGPLQEDRDEENNNSLVLSFHSPWGSILFGGDMLLKEERELLQKGLIPACEILKVPYHGGDKATSQALVDAVKPRVAVISTSTRERESTPSPDVVYKLAQAGAKVLVTQEAQGAIWITLPDLSADPVAFATVPQSITPVQIQQVSLGSEVITLSCHTGEAIELKGWYLYSDRGDECYFFPEDTVLPAGQTLTVGTLTTPLGTSLVWPEKNVIHNSKDDTLTLYDPWGRSVSVWQNGK
ncbi:MAG: lamin tail domain-containing protein [Clostridia bacterium]|nr:lamin tail domain-containing protein [Clostridia bacterium]